METKEMLEGSTESTEWTWGLELSFLTCAEYGGLGLDFSYSAAVAEELGSIRCGGIPMAIGVQSDMATPALARYCPGKETCIVFSDFIILRSCQWTLSHGYFIF